MRMRLHHCGLLAALLLMASASANPQAGLAAAQDDLDSALAALIAEYDADYALWYEQYLATQGENRADLPDRRPVARKLLELVADAPASDAAYEACTWTLTSVHDPSVQDPALDILTAHHMERPALEQLALEVRGGTRAANRFLEAALQQATMPASKGALCYELGKGLMRMTRGADLSLEEVKVIEASAERAFGRCAIEFADVVLHADPDGDTSKDVLLGKRVQRDLFELRFLTPGKTAPDVTGEDLGGVPFKLSDYRGKVVMLDFWGDW